VEHIEAGTVRGWLHLPEKATGDGLVFGHGAGGDSNAALIKAVAEAFSAQGIAVLRVDLVFRQLGRTPSPAMQPRDREGLREAVEFLRKHAARRMFLGGHSYGGRQASILASALVLFSYPLHPPGKPQQLRTDHFPALRVPVLFAHGTRDAFGSPEELRTAIKAIPGPTELVIVEKAGHGLPVAAVADVAAKFREFVKR
jgi:predicted alpha/beta-hydrolase family hydrolase